MRRYPKPAPTKADKRAAAAALLIMSSRPLDELERVLVASYGFSAPEAARAIAAEKARRAA